MFALGLGCCPFLCSPPPVCYLLCSALLVLTIYFSASALEALFAPLPSAFDDHALGYLNKSGSEEKVQWLCSIPEVCVPNISFGRGVFLSSLQKVAGIDKSPLPVRDPLSPSIAIKVRRLGSILSAGSDFLTDHCLPSSQLHFPHL